MPYYSWYGQWENWRASCNKWAQFWHVAFHFIEKYTPYLSLLVSLSFTINNVCKNAVFFLAVSFPKKAFVFPNNRISEAPICCQCWFKKISWKRKTKQQKKLQGNVFPLSPRSHAKIELIWTRTKICPKKSLTTFLQEALQLIDKTKNQWKKSISIINILISLID